MNQTELPRPKVGLAVHIYKDGQVLMMYRLGKHGGHCWAPPGGKLEHGEDFWHCNQREIKEELDLDIQDAELVGVTNDIYETGEHYVTLHFLCAKFLGKPKTMEPEKCREIQWFPLDQLPQPLLLSTANFYVSNPSCLCGSGKKYLECHGRSNHS